MVYGFVKQSAGHIKIYSEEGHGTTIRMYLPPGTGASLARGRCGAGRRAATKPSWSSKTTGWCAAYVLTQLRSLGYVTLEAASGAEALDIVKAGNAFDLLFTDVIMPGAMNGRQLADEVQKIKPGSRCCTPRAIPRMRSSDHGRLDLPACCCLPSRIASRKWP